MPQWWEEFLGRVGLKSESISRIRLGPGVVGRNSQLILALIVAYVLLAFQLGNVWLTAGGFILLFGLVVWFARSSFEFGEKHPHAALLEGADLVQWKQVELASKEMVAPAGATSIKNPQTQQPALIHVEKDTE